MKEFLHDHFSEIIGLATAGLIVFAVFWYSFVPHEYLGSTEADSTLTFTMSDRVTTLLEIRNNDESVMDKIIINEEAKDMVVYKDSTGEYPLLISCGEQYLWANTTDELFERYTQEEMEEVLDCFYGISSAFYTSYRNKFIQYKGWH